MAHAGVCAAHAAETIAHYRRLRDASVLQSFEEA
jgi:hypothetical protein